MRHYELLNLSRRPKPEAFEFMKLIERYSAPEDSVRIIESSHEAVEVDDQSHATVNISITNAGAVLLRLRASVETGGGLNAELLTNSPLILPAGQSAEIPVDRCRDQTARPGFYHAFVRLESDDGLMRKPLLRYLWAEVRVPGAPQMDHAEADLNFDFSTPVTVAYAQKASVRGKSGKPPSPSAKPWKALPPEWRSPFCPCQMCRRNPLNHLIYVGSADGGPW